MKLIFLSCNHISLFLLPPLLSSVPPSLLSHPSLFLPPSLQVCQVTLQLFDILLQCSLPSVLQDLVFGHLAGTTCATPTTGNSIASRLDDITAERQSLEDTVSRCVEAPGKLNLN